MIYAKFGIDMMLHMMFALLKVFPDSIYFLS